MGDWGRFTVAGGQALERRIGEMMDEAASALDGALAPREYRSVVLLGGYGRGEGGVDVRDGVEHPNNNFDFLIVARRGADTADLKWRADQALAPLARAWGLGIDVSAISEAGLRRSPCLVIWYDMRFGHKPVLGDRNWVRRLSRFRRDRIEPWDVRNLLVNRGTLLVINTVLLEQGELDRAQQRAVVRHGVKAVIGYGDALLFFLGDYDWSYAEKQRRMRRRTDVPEALRALYEEAMELRFRPRYDDFAGRDLRAWNDSLHETLEPVHRRCEALRLGQGEIGWDDYPDLAFRHQLTEGLARPTMAARKAVGLARSIREEGVPLGAQARIGWRASRPRERLPLLFPAVAYDVDAPRLTGIARRALGAKGADRSTLARAYLREWGVHGDINFPAALAKLGIQLGVRP